MRYICSIRLDRKKRWSLYAEKCDELICKWIHIKKVYENLRGQANRRGEGGDIPSSASISEAVQKDKAAEIRQVSARYTMSDRQF